MKSKVIRVSLIILLTLICVSLDQVSKYIAIKELVEFESVSVIDNFFYFTLCYNTGGAWSIFSNATIILTIISFIALIVIIYTLFKFKDKFYTIIASLFMGGLLGNLIDRVLSGKVTDFIDFKIFGYDFPVFNIADILIVVSAFMLAIYMLKDDKNGKDSSK